MTNRFNIAALCLFWISAPHTQAALSTPDSPHAEIVYGYASVVESVGLSELAATFSEAKLESLTGSKHQDAAYALLVAIGVLDADSQAAVLSELEMEALVGLVLQTPVYQASLSIADPVAELDTDYQRLEALLFKALAADITTGYNVTVAADWPDYDPERMLIYGHNNLQHMRQLLFLLQTEGLEPEFQFLPKRSAFKIREGWGVANAATPRLPDGTPVAQITEYELFMQFAEPEERMLFQRLVTQYAKKDSEDEPGLLHRSWWQPFYRSQVPSGAMQETSEIWVSIGGLKANILSLPGEASKKLTDLRELSSAWEIEKIPLWVNPSFYRYLEGDFK